MIRKKLVCACDNSTCDTLEFTWPVRSGQTYLVESTKSGKRFSGRQVEETSASEQTGVANRVRIDLSKRYQEILGWGGAFTDASLININSLSARLGQKLLESYYGESGLQYNFARVPIAGTDFSTRFYTYDDSSDNFNLSQWKLADEDLNLKIPYLRKAIALTGITGDRLKLFASPWSPPVWMKTLRQATHCGLIDEDRVYTTYAEYLIKFYQAYEEAGIDFWGATVQNEPRAASLPEYTFNSCEFSNEQISNFVARYLGPALEKSGKNKSNFKLMIGDDFLSYTRDIAEGCLVDDQVSKYVSGLAFHWYARDKEPYDTLTKVYEQFKEKIEFVIMTEACNGYQANDAGVDPGSWQRGVNYADDIVQDFTRNTGAWIDWNLALDLGGGPNWASNFVDSPILVDKDRDQFYKQPMYYALAHLSRFFRPGSVRVDAQVESANGSLSTIAGLTKDLAHLVVFLLNDSDQDRRIRLELDQTGAVERVRQFEVEKNSFNTLVMKL